MKMHLNEMNKHSEVNKKKKKEVMRKIKDINYYFHHITKNAGRGVNGSLKTLHEKM